MQKRHTRHRPVLLRETLQGLELKSGLTVVDGTVGAAGHSSEIWKKIQPEGQLLGLDRDTEMLNRAATTLGISFPTDPNSPLQLQQGSYITLGEQLSELGWGLADRVLADLGLSSDQLESESRGFGFKTDGALDMRFDQSSGEPILTWLKQASVEEITTVLADYGEEPQAKLIAERVSERARQGTLETAGELGDLIAELYRKDPRQLKSSHPATRTFQALRIQANAELVHLKEFLSTAAPAAIVPGGLLAVITFHSLEDRMTKQAFQDRTVWASATSKPIEATSLEKKMNPRSRSAKLRIAIRAD